MGEGALHDDSFVGLCVSVIPTKPLISPEGRALRAFLLPAARGSLRPRSSPLAVRCSRRRDGTPAMVRFLLQRIVYALLVMLAVASLAFAAVHLSGDPLAGFTAPGASPADK